jgi:hypothetical protein
VWSALWKWLTSWNSFAIELLQVLVQPARTRKFKEAVGELRRAIREELLNSRPAFSLTRRFLVEGARCSAASRRLTMNARVWGFASIVQFDIDIREVNMSIGEGVDWNPIIGELMSVEQLPRNNSANYLHAQILWMANVGRMRVVFGAKTSGAHEGLVTNVGMPMVLGACRFVCCTKKCAKVVLRRRSRHLIRAVVRCFTMVVVVWLTPDVRW